MNTNSFAPVNNIGLFDEIASTLSKHFNSVDVDRDYQTITCAETNANDELIHSISVAFQKTTLSVGNDNVIVPVITITDEEFVSSVKKFTDIIIDVSNKVFIKRLNSCCVQIIYGCNENTKESNIVNKIIKKALDLMIIDNIADDN